MKTLRIFVFIFIVTLVLSGCGKTEEDKAQEQAPVDKSAPGLIVP